MDPQAIYDSAIHSPISIWIANAVVAALAIWKRPRLWPYLTGFAALAAFDVFATAAYAPAALKAAPFYTALTIGLVIAGDYRYFALIELHRDGAAPFARLAPWLRAVPFAFVVPVISAIPQKLWPERFVEPRNIFLLYEVCFVVFALALRAWILPRTLARTPEPVRRWLLELTSFELTHYALWAIADVVILSGATWGHLLRIVPNLLYYAGYLPFVWWRAPREDRARLDI